MSDMSYELLFGEVKKIVTKYALAAMMDGYDVELVNLLLTNNIDRLIEAKTYEATVEMINEAGTAYMATTYFPIAFHVDSFVTEEVDRQLLYQIFKCWRSKLIREEDVMSKIAVFERTHVSHSTGERNL